MSATFNFGGDNGTATGSPAHGTTRSGIGNSTYVTALNWTATDDFTTSAASSPLVVTSGGGTVYSMPKYIYGIFSGTFTTISNCKWYHSSGTAGTGITLAGKVTSTYATPAQTALSGTSDMTSTVSFSSGLSVDFSTTDPSAASPTSTLSAPGYTQYLVAQLAADGSSVSAGDSSTFAFTLEYDEV
jgi:hypothetical protein